MLFRILLAVVIAGAVLLTLWLLRGVMLTPVRTGKNASLAMVLTVSGPAPELENTVDALMWLGQNGTLRARLVVRDAGMDSQTRQVAEILQRRGAIQLIK
jgi:hypothetical protein